MIGQISGEQLGERCHAFGDAFDDAELRRSSSERSDERRQNPIRHFAGRVIEERGKAEGVDVARSGLVRGEFVAHIQKIARREKASGLRRQVSGKTKKKGRRCEEKRGVRPQEKPTVVAIELSGRETDTSGNPVFSWLKTLDRAIQNFSYLFCFQIQATKGDGFYIAQIMGDFQLRFQFKQGAAGVAQKLYKFSV